MSQDGTFTIRFPDGRQYGPAAMPMIEQWAREGRVPRHAVLVPSDGSPAIAVMSIPQLAAVLSAPIPVPHHPPLQPVRSAPPPDTTPGPAMIPSRNPCALVGYYLGVFSLLPFVGLLLGPPAVILGIIGVVARVRKPHIRGALHAVIAIVLGLVGPIAGILLYYFAAARFDL